MTDEEFNLWLAEGLENLAVGLALGVGAVIAVMALMAIVGLLFLW